MRPAGPLIELSRCSLILDGHVVLDEIDFVLRRGERWALIGPNGAGKTLLLKMLRGDVWPTPTGRERRSSQLDKEHIAYVGPERQEAFAQSANPHGPALVPRESLDRNVDIDVEPLRGPRSRVEALEVAALVRDPYVLAVGEQRRHGGLAFSSTGQ